MSPEGTHPINPTLPDPYWLVVWNHGILTDFPYIGNGITSQLTNIFFRGVETTNQRIVFHKMDVDGCMHGFVIVHMAMKGLIAHFTFLSKHIRGNIGSSIPTI